MKIFIPLVLVGLALGSTAVPAVAAAPVYTNKLKFRIPFHSDAEELKRLGAREIRLDVSRDQGRRWSQVQAVAPDAGKFNFQAPGDGEYWFIVRTLDSKQRLHPDVDTNDPGLQVIVDTTPPKLQISLKQLSPGRVEMSWTASDEHLDLSLLRLEYIQPGTLEWESIGVAPRASDKIEWSVPQAGLVSVRGSISDFAKNTTQAEDRVRVSVGPAVPKPHGPDHRQPVAGFGNSPFDEQALSMPERFPGSSLAVSKPRTEPALVQRADPTPFVATRTAQDSGGTVGSLVSQRTDEFPGGPRIESDRREPPPEEVRSDRRVVASRKFQIGYKLHDLAPASIAAVELYITKDNGRKWFRYGVDEDKKSPVQIEVAEEGVYGFWLGIRTADGNATEAPRDGDLPALEIVVDLTPPHIELLPLKHLRGPHDDKVVIQWKYDDEFPADKPVSLYYAASPNGQWQKISDWTENTGKYSWKVDADLPSRFLVRIEARDKAGNIQIAESPRPVAVNLTRPTAR